MQKDQINANSKAFKALGHSKRLEIITLLQGHKLTVGQIVQMTALRQSSVSQHLMLLKDLDLVCTTREGKEIYYSLCQEKFFALTKFVKNLSQSSPNEDAEPSVIDPICHMTLTPSSAAYNCTYNGVREYFCGKGCLNEFRKLHL